MEGTGYIYLNAGEKSITLYNKVEKLESALIEKTQKAFGKTLPKSVDYEKIEETAKFIIDEILMPQTSK